MTATDSRPRPGQLPGVAGHRPCGPDRAEHRRPASGLPVNFAIIDEDVLIRTAPGSKLDAAATNAVVAFEADRIDAVYHGGWSVLVQGIATEITDPLELEQARRAPLNPWSGVDGHYLRVATQFVLGRRLGPGSHREGVGNGAVD